MKFVHIGFGNYVNPGKVVAIIKPDSSPVKKLKKQAADNFRLVDVRFGRKVRSILVMNSGHIVLSGVSEEALLERFKEVENGA